MSEAAAKQMGVLFDRFLAWLDFQRERAIATYEGFRLRLAVFFRRRGQGSDAEDLASEVLQRAAAICIEGRLDGIAPQHYIFGIARNVRREAYKQTRTSLQLDEIDPVDPAPSFETVMVDNDRLRHCLAMLPADERELLLRYYQNDSPIGRKALAKEKGLSRAHLSVRICTIKNKILDRLKQGNDPPST